MSAWCILPRAALLSLYRVALQAEEIRLSDSFTRYGQNGRNDFQSLPNRNIHCQSPFFALPYNPNIRSSCAWPMNLVESKFNLDEFPRRSGNLIRTPEAGSRVHAIHLVDLWPKKTSAGKESVLGGIRTHGLQIRNLPLYPPELRGQIGFSLFTRRLSNLLAIENEMNNASRAAI